MQHIISLDPRITREQIPVEFDKPLPEKDDLDQFQSFEVFQQMKSGGHFTHVGSIHAPDPQIALTFAKEIYGRRGSTHGMWVIQTDNIHALNTDDIDIFKTASTPDKDYREVTSYNHVREKIEALKKAEISTDKLF